MDLPRLLSHYHQIQVEFFPLISETLYTLANKSFLWPLGCRRCENMPFIDHYQSARPGLSTAFKESFPPLFPLSPQRFQRSCRSYHSHLLIVFREVHYNGPALSFEERIQVFICTGLPPNAQLGNVFQPQLVVAPFFTTCAVSSFPLGEPSIATAARVPSRPPKWPYKTGSLYEISSDSRRTVTLDHPSSSAIRRALSTAARASIHHRAPAPYMGKASII